MIAIFLILLTTLTGIAAAQDDETTITVEGYDGLPVDVITELERMELIEQGGTPITAEDEVTVRGRGEASVPIGYPATANDLVMAAELTFTTEDADESAICGLIARVDRVESGLGSYVNVGISGTGDLVILDVRGAGEEPTTMETVPLELDLSESHHLLVLLLHERATVFVDGELAAEDIPIFQQDGTVGVLFVNQESDARCVARNHWAYEVPPPTDMETCEVRGGSRPTNRRSGPGTNFSVVGRLVNRAAMAAQGQAVDRSGQLWWQLEDGSWVRDDVVAAVGNCASLPTVEP
jgi:hypothetical protein